jgi:hypothetical protein
VADGGNLLRGDDASPTKGGTGTASENGVYHRTVDPTASAGEGSSEVSIGYHYPPYPQPDLDGNGIADIDEDTDGDGLPDAWEIVCGLNHLDSTLQDGLNGDSDYDGFTNLEEYELGGSPTSPEKSGEQLVVRLKEAAFRTEDPFRVEIENSAECNGINDDYPQIANAWFEIGPLDAPEYIVAITVRGAVECTPPQNSPYHDADRVTMNSYDDLQVARDYKVFFNCGAPAEELDECDPCEMVIKEAVKFVALPRDGRLKLEYNTLLGVYHCGAYAEVIDAYIIDSGLTIWNGGSEIGYSNSAEYKTNGEKVLDCNEEPIGAYILVNWDDDDADGMMNYDGSWSALPVPDLEENYVLNENNLAKLQPNVSQLSDFELIVLEISGDDAGTVKLWTQETKGTPVPLSSGIVVWDLLDQTQKEDFEAFMNHGYWIEGVSAGEAERQVNFTIRFYDHDGTEICNDFCNATVVDLRMIGSAVYRSLDYTFITGAGHAGLITGFIGKCNLSQLADSSKYEVVEMLKSASGCVRTTWQRFARASTYWGLYDCSPSYVERLRILRVADYIARGEGAKVEYCWTDALQPGVWNGDLDAVTALRCDGLVELCYELNGVNVWGKIVNGVPRYSIVTYTGEHNYMDTPWMDFLTPAAQSGRISSPNWNTSFTPVWLPLIPMIGPITW